MHWLVMHKILCGRIDGNRRLQCLPGGGALAGWDWVGGILSSFYIFSCTFQILSHANLSPIQKINKYFFGSERKKKKKGPSGSLVDNGF